MARQNPAIENLNHSGLNELWKRIGFVFLAIIIYRVSTHIPLPGVNLALLSQLFKQNSGTILSLFNMFSGGSIERMSITAMGVMPYISASIIMQLMTAVTPHLDQLKKEGEQGRRKITQYTRYLTLLLGALQAYGFATALTSQGLGADHWSFFFTTIVTLVTGTMFLMWLGEQITERGIGNGISIIIFAGIVSGIPSAIGQALESSRQGELELLVLLLVSAVVIGVVFGVVFIERGQRRITVNYAKRQQGKRVFAAQQSHLPLKVNTAGVIPPIFASTILLFPATLSSWFGEGDGLSWLQEISLAISPGQPLYALLFALGIVFFCYFYTAIMFNSKEIADNLKRSGAFIPGIRPGEQSARYIDKVLSRLTLIGAIYIASVCLIPEFLVIGTGTPFQFGGTSMLIVVVVVMDMMTQIQSHLMSTQYESLMKKANLKGQSR